MGRCCCHPPQAGTSLCLDLAQPPGLPPTPTPFPTSPSCAHPGLGKSCGVWSYQLYCAPYSFQPSQPISLLVSDVICRFLVVLLLLLFGGTPAEPGARQIAGLLTPAKVLRDFGERKGEGTTERQAVAWAGLFAKAWPGAGRSSGLGSRSQLRSQWLCLQGCCVGPKQRPSCLQGVGSEGKVSLLP